MTIRHRPFPTPTETENPKPTHPNTPIQPGPPASSARTVRAPRGTSLTAKSWQTEAPLRMLMNNLDPEVAEHPEDLVVYGGGGKAARNWEAFDGIVQALRELGTDETLLIQSGKPVGVFTTHEWAPRVLIANANLVGEWATWPHFRHLEELGVTMYGQMTAGSWIYIGTQGIVQGTYETFAAIGAKRFGGTLRGTLTLTAGAGGMGGAQGLAVTMNEGAVLIADVDPTRLARRVEHGYLDEYHDDVDTALRRAVEAKARGEARSVGVVANAAWLFPELLRRGAPIDIVTDQTSAHDPLMYLPEEVGLGEWKRFAADDAPTFTKLARSSMARQVDAMVGFMDRG
ncbi:MAG: urocanate hydratase, partial [Bifidobacteriaceae bacterium]|nr:urocanate hydratase [Bifidobacteriaceae bacterium]